MTAFTSTPSSGTSTDYCGRPHQHPTSVAHGLNFCSTTKLQLTYRSKHFGAPGPLRWNSGHAPLPPWSDASPYTHTPTTYTDVHLPHADPQDLGLHRHRLPRPTPPTPPLAPCPSRPLARRTCCSPPLRRPATHAQRHPTQYQQPRATALAPPLACQPTPTSQDRDSCPHQPQHPTPPQRSARQIMGTGKVHW